MSQDTLLRLLTWLGVLTLSLVFWSVLIICVMGCGRRQVQDFSDAGAGARAWQQEQDPAKREIIARGVMGHLLAALENYPLLPAPSHSPAEIRANPAAYAADGEAAQADPQPYAPEDHPAPTPPTPNPLREVGTTAMRWGAIAFAIAGVLWLVGTFGWAGGGIIGRIITSQVVGGLARLGVSLGAGSVITGAGLVWIAEYLWWILAGLAVGFAAFHWKDLLAAWNKARGIVKRKPSLPSAAKCYSADTPHDQE